MISYKKIALCFIILPAFASDKPSCWQRTKSMVSHGFTSIDRSLRVWKHKKYIRQCY